MPNSSPIVFVVDDDASVRESLALLIDSAGWQPLTVKTRDRDLTVRARRGYAAGTRDGSEINSASEAGRAAPSPSRLPEASTTKQRRLR